MPQSSRHQMTLKKPTSPRDITASSSSSISSSSTMSSTSLTSQPQPTPAAKPNSPGGSTGGSNSFTALSPSTTSSTTNATPKSVTPSVISGSFACCSPVISTATSSPVPSSTTNNPNNSISPATIFHGGVATTSPASARTLVARIAKPTKQLLSLNLLKYSSVDDSMLKEKARRGSDESRTDAEIIYEEREVVPGVRIRAATLERLLEEVLSKFEKDRLEEVEWRLPHVIFLMHHWFITSADLAQLLITHISPRVVSSSSAVPSNTSRDTKEQRRPATSATTSKSSSNSNSSFSFASCRAVGLAFAFWIDHYSEDFLYDKSALDVLENFIAHLREIGRAELADGLENRYKKAFEIQRKQSSRRSFMLQSKCSASSLSTPAPSSSSTNLSPNHSTQTTSVEEEQHQVRAISLVFHQIPPVQIAQQLTVLEYKSIRAIKFHDLHRYALHNSLSESPHLERSVRLFNGISQWVQCMILRKTTPQERAKVVAKFVDIAKQLLLDYNMNTFFAIIGGLCHSTISRLSKTLACLSQSVHKCLKEYSEILSSSRNFSVYRKRLQNAKEFCLPVIAIHMKDLIFYHTAMQDVIGKNLLNIRKLAQISTTLQIILSVREMQLNVAINRDLCNTLRLCFDMNYSEEEIYELSLAREPKTLNSTLNGMHSSFREFVAETKPPDPSTLEKHVEAMIEAVFKVYDHDKDGFISSSEFEEVAENFPFMDSFAVLDSDCDGMISKAEMKRYFIRANHNALKNSFKHDFHEITYFRPTFCSHCTGLLWGLIKQGWHCKDCGINAHSHCKDQVVMECRPNRISNTPILPHRSHSSFSSVDSSTSTSGSNVTNITSNTTESDACITSNKKRRMSMRHHRLQQQHTVSSPLGTVSCGQADKCVQTEDHGLSLSVDIGRSRTNSMLDGETYKGRRHKSVETALSRRRPAAHHEADLQQLKVIDDIEKTALRLEVERLRNEKEQLVEEVQHLQVLLGQYWEDVRSCRHHIQTSTSRMD